LRLTFSRPVMVKRSSFTTMTWTVSQMAAGQFPGGLRPISSNCKCAPAQITYGCSRTFLIWWMAACRWLSKSSPCSGAMRKATLSAALLIRSNAYKGPACIKTFDPDMLAVAKAHNNSVLRGIVADAARPGPDYTRHSRMDRFILRHLLHFPRTSPHFISYGVNDLPSPGPSMMKKVFRDPNHGLDGPDTRTVGSRKTVCRSNRL
jgi:hypothetical protein